MTHTPGAGREIAIMRPSPAHMRPTVIVMPTETYRKLAEALLNIKPDWFADKVDLCGVKLVLGEFGDIWPASLFEPDEPAEAPAPVRLPVHDVPVDIGDMDLSDLLDGLDGHP